MSKYIRKGEDKLFISYQKPHNAVAKSTIQRWCKRVVSGIDIERYGPHSIRAASTSSARNDGVPLATIMAAARCINARTFKPFYDKNIEETLDSRISNPEMILT